MVNYGTSYRTLWHKKVRVGNLRQIAGLSLNTVNMNISPHLLFRLLSKEMKLAYHLELSNEQNRRLNRQAIIVTTFNPPSGYPTFTQAPVRFLFICDLDTAISNDFNSIIFRLIRRQYIHSLNDSDTNKLSFP